MENNKKESINKESTSKESINKESANKESIDKENVNKESVNKESVNKESIDKEKINTKISTGNYIDKIYTAKRKRSICRLKINNKHTGIHVNNKEISKYFYESVFRYQNQIDALLNLFSLKKSLSFSCNIVGGGKSSQCDSIIYALAKALRAKVNIEFADDKISQGKMYTLLRNTGYLTVDTRKVEPKKYGRRKARAREQFVRR
jgi:small subunit ribosomal protein S9